MSANPMKPSFTAPIADSEPRGRRGLDTELQAMAKIDRLMDELPQPAADLVYGWFTHKFAPTESA